MNKKVLLLNSDYSPLRVISWKKAFDYLYSEKAVQVSCYEDCFVNTPNARYPLPAVVVLKSYHQNNRTPALSKKNIYKRDSFTCQYCKRPSSVFSKDQNNYLTVDHVVPKSLAKYGYVTSVKGKKVLVHSWENLTTACSKCNSKKSNRTPSQALMGLKILPYRPTTLSLSLSRNPNFEIPEEWKLFIPETLD